MLSYTRIKETREEFEYNYNELPEWYKYNDLIHLGYRPWNKKILYYTKSIFKCHNEILNIWSHLVGVFIYIILFILYHFQYFNVPYNYHNYIIMVVYIFTAIFCFMFSTIMHIYYPCSCNSNINLCKLDYVGITLLISGSYCPIVYYTYICERKMRIIYFIIINTLAFINIIISLMAFMGNVKYHFIKIMIFVVYATLIIIPLFYKYIEDGYHLNYLFTYEIKCYLVSLTFYILSLIINCTRFPESKIKNIVYASSHFYFHVCVLMGSFCLFYGILLIQQKFRFIDCLHNITTL